MDVLQYPSKSFGQSVERLCKVGRNFIIRVPAASSEKRILLQKLPLILEEEGAREERGLGSAIYSIRILGFYQAVAAPMERGYRLRYEDVGDLVIHMTASACTGFERYDAEDYAGALSAFNTEAAGGSVAALVWLGYLHETGKGVVADPEQAERYYRQATEAGSDSGPHYLGNLLMRSDRIAEAVAAFETAALRGFSPAIYRLGSLHELGHGVVMDKMKAERLYWDAAKLGNLWAQRKIAGRMARGRYGVSRIVPGVLKIVALAGFAILIGSQDNGDPRLVR
jgi:hypothetical protein